MDSDIDIEEHNLFENPELRDLFPDITVIKQEIYDENIEVFNIQNCYKTMLQDGPIQGTIEDTEYNDHKGAVKNIGSKPKCSPTSQENGIKHNLSRHVKIILSDLKPILLNSNRYCKSCSILFPNKANLTDHRNIVHGEKYICDKCGNNFYQQGNLTRHLKNVHKIKIQRNRFGKLDKNVQTHFVQDPIKESSRCTAVLPTVACFHCTKTFESNQLLIEHLYTVLEPKVKKQASLQLIAKSKEPNYRIHRKNRTVLPTKQKNVDRNLCIHKKSPNTLNNNDLQLFFKCHKCLHYFKNDDLFIKHVKLKHRIQDFPMKRVPFNTKCELCSQHCNNVRLYNRHIHNHHLVMMKRKKIKSTYKRKIICSKKETSNRRLNIFILKDYLFQCHQCDIYFVSPSEALNHTKHSENRSHWKCLECQFTFKRNEGKYHLNQHTFTKSYTTIKIDDSTFSKILFHCSKCNIHFQEQHFIEHYADCGIRTPSSEYCDICDSLIDQKLKTSHRHIHNANTNSYSDFRIIKIIDNCLWRQKFVEVSLNTSLRNTNLHLYYCKTCKCCVTQIHNIHRQSLCGNLIKHACRYCGLTLTNKGIMAHRSIHYSNPLLKLQDFAFYDLETGKKISPPLPKFQKCEGCNKHVFNKTFLNSHICGEDADFVCPICDIKCSEIVYKLHLPFHEYNLNGIDICPLNKNSNVERTLDTDMYCCKICLIQFDSYDKVIEHCQFHILNRDTNQNLEHLKQGSYSRDIIDGKNVYYFEPYYYGSRDVIWLRHIFNGLSPEEISKKLIHSIYRFESRIKLTIYQEGSCEYTEYKCMNCQCFIENSTLFSHVEACGSSQHKTHACTVCKNMYLSQIALSQHMQMHKNSFDMTNIRIVSFNESSSKKMNELIKLNPTRPHYVLYRCRNCEGLVNKTEFLKHVCNLNDLQKCNHCGLLLYSDGYESHLLKHKNLSSFTGGNMKVILLGDKSPGLKENPAVSTSFMGIVCDFIFYKCTKCDVCIRYARCISKHFCLVDAAKAKCGLCDLYFEQGKLKAHTKLHSEDPEFVNGNIITVTFVPKASDERVPSAAPKLLDSTRASVFKITEQELGEAVSGQGRIVLYRCAKCNLHFMSKRQASEHVKKSPGRVTKQHCTKCGIPFSPTVLFDHLMNHHKTYIETIYVVDVFGVYKKRKIFQCANCKLHFTNAKKTSEHSLKCLGDATEGENCKCCGLLFHYSYLLNHEHSAQYNMHTDYEIVEV